MTIDKYIDLFRTALLQTSDDSPYDDAYIYEQMVVVRNKLLTDELKRGKYLNDFYYQRFCMKMCPSDWIECNCEPIDFGCTVWRSKEPIPKFVASSHNMLLEVSELYGDAIYKMGERASRYLKYRNIKEKTRMFYSIQHTKGDYYLYLQIGERIAPPKYIKLRGILEDPMQAFSANCEEEDCPDLLSKEFPIPSDLGWRFQSLVFELLGISTSINQDRSNNAEGQLSQFAPPRRGTGGRDGQGEE